MQEAKDKKGKKDAPAAAAMDVVSVDELNQKIATLEKEKNKEEEYRNYMQLERVSLAAVRELLHSYCVCITLHRVSQSRQQLGPQPLPASFYTVQCTPYLTRPWLSSKCGLVQFDTRLHLFQL